MNLIRISLLILEVFCTFITYQIRLRRGTVLMQAHLLCSLRVFVFILKELAKGENSSEMGMELSSRSPLRLSAGMWCGWKWHWFSSCEHVPARHSTLHVLLQDRSTAVQIRSSRRSSSCQSPSLLTLRSSSCASPCSFLSPFTVGWTSTDAGTAVKRKEPSMKCAQSSCETVSRQEWIFLCIIFAFCYYLIAVLCRM